MPERIELFRIEAPDTTIIRLIYVVSSAWSKNMVIQVNRPLVPGQSRRSWRMIRRFKSPEEAVHFSDTTRERGLPRYLREDQALVDELCQAVRDIAYPDL